MMLLILFLVSPITAQWLLLQQDAPTVITTEDTAMIPPRHECGAWCIGDDIYVYGGSNTGILNDFWKYETENRRWLWMPDVPAELGPKSNFAYWTILDQIYLYHQSMWHYDPDTRVWTKLGPTSNDGGPPKDLIRSAFWVHKPGNDLYMYGGWTNQSSTSDMWVFNIVTNSWRQITYYGEGPLLIGEQTNSALLGSSEDTVYYFDEKLYQLDLPTLTWSVSPIEGTSQPPDREHYTLFMTSLQDKIALFGGHLGAKLLNDYWIYDPNINDWIKAENNNGPSGRWGSCGCTDGRGDYYLFGGTYEDPKHFHNDLWKNGPLSAKNIFQILDFKLDSVTLSSLVAAAMSTILVCVLFLSLLCLCVKKCRRERHLINSYKADHETGISL